MTSLVGRAFIAEHYMSKFTFKPNNVHLCACFVRIVAGIFSKGVFLLSPSVPDVFSMCAGKTNTAAL